ncbi:HNH endonuclease [Vibrio gazogenes]|uniref:HNH endonuclease signature motif containing protein n=1 Tax=Vibrio gazogenes TaxID=687 RepID=UPI0018DFE6F9|nr:HNH endonuclease [Vibrio gazogenes]
MDNKATNCPRSPVNPDRIVNGRKIINSDLAGTKVKTAGGDVWFDNDGFPDFSPYSQKSVRVDGLTGDMSNDVPLAMKKANLSTYDETNYVWHHHQDTKTMMLVPRSVHSVRNDGVAHTGGRAVMQHNLKNPTIKLQYPSPPEKL